MKILVQRVKNASVTISDNLYSSINHGILAFVGIEKNDTEELLEKAVKKIKNLRIFSDENGKMNKSIIDVSGEMLVVSQFTLCGDCKKGTRPSFDNSASPEFANKMYEDFILQIRNAGIKTEHGVFGADMKVQLLNDGPVTFMLEF